MTRSLSAAAVAVVTAAALAVLTSCSSDDDPAANGSETNGSEANGTDAGDANGAGGSDESTESASQAPDPPTPSPTPTPTPSPTPTLPEPADGENGDACADGTCEVRVTEGATLPVPQSYGLGPIEVTGVTEDVVELFGPMTQARYASDGGCSMSITGPTATSPGFLALSCPAGNTGIVNEAMSVEVVGVLDGAAVLRIEPA
ncbi:hypothetical protein ACTWP5_14750 [Streptomyces sp. 4N509B]|uniref:hypothetical protein n=1 Tax=Streptomyces sp. 4N509B TaxID=3457413 RepID=UPI003FCEF7FC